MLGRFLQYKFIKAMNLTYPGFQSNVTENSGYLNDERRRAGEWAVGRAGVNFSFPEHNSATLKVF